MDMVHTVCFGENSSAYVVILVIMDMVHTKHQRQPTEFGVVILVIMDMVHTKHSRRENQSLSCNPCYNGYGAHRVIHKLLIYCAL